MTLKFSNRYELFMMLSSIKESSIVVQIINSIAQENFFTTLAKQVSNIASYDSLVMMIYSNHAIPEIIHDEIKELSYQIFKSTYLQGAYLLSPLYIAHRQHRYGCFSFDDLIPDGFYQSEYYRSYYSKCGLTDQLVLLIDIDNQQTLAISLGLLSGKYDEQTKQTMIKLSEVIQSLVVKHWQLNNAKQGQNLPSQTLQNQLQNAFDLFASSVLTQREQAVIQTLMQGHSSKSAAKLLNISVDTERSYRKSAYSKLDISSQSELFNLFFSCLSFADRCQQQDPLILLFEK